MLAAASRGGGAGLCGRRVVAAQSSCVGRGEVLQESLRGVGISEDVLAGVLGRGRSMGLEGVTAAESGRRWGPASRGECATYALSEYYSEPGVAKSLEVAPVFSLKVSSMPESDLSPI